MTKGVVTPSELNNAAIKQSQNIRFGPPGAKTILWLHVTALTTALATLSPSGSLPETCPLAQVRVRVMNIFWPEDRAIQQGSSVKVPVSEKGLDSVPAVSILFIRDFLSIF